MHRLAFHLGLGIIIAAAPATAAQKAHEHGHAALNIAIEDDGIEMELISPGADIVGFEHAPDTDADRAAVQDAIAKFQKGLFTLPEAAGCELEAVGIYSSLLPDGKPIHSGDHHHDEDHKDDHGHGDKDDDHKHDDHKDDHAGHDDEEHAEFRVHFHYECNDTAALTGLSTSYFAEFPNAQELDAAALTANGQVAAELTAGDASLKF